MSQVLVFIKICPHVSSQCFQSILVLLSMKNYFSGKQERGKRERGKEGKTNKRKNTWQFNLRALILNSAIGLSSGQSQIAPPWQSDLDPRLYLLVPWVRTFLSLMFSIGVEVEEIREKRKKKSICLENTVSPMP